MANEINRL